MSARFKTKIIHTNPKAVDKLAKRLKKKAHVEVGIIKAEKKEDSEGLTVAEVAYYNEFGTENIPERSFFRSALKEQRNKLKLLQAEYSKDMVQGKKDINTSLGLMGDYLAGEIRQKIVDIKDPKNAPGTIKRKGSSNPLVDKGQMLQSITYGVKNGKPK